MDYVEKYLHVDKKPIGYGGFGRVLAAIPLNQSHQQAESPTSSPITQNVNRQTLALKWLHSIVRPHRLANELRCLRDLGGQGNVVRMHTAHLHMGSLFIVMDLIEHDRFSDVVTDLHYAEIVAYMKNLLIALQHVHRYNIVHRDIKPTNFLYNRKQSKFQLVDFGLAQVQRPKHNLFNTTPHQASPRTPNISTKRLLSTDVDLTFKRLRVSNCDETREPVKLTVGAYESPITTNDNRTRQNDNRTGQNGTASEHKFSTPKVPRRPFNTRCGCFNKPRTCSICIGRKESDAPRSGTSGFKAPETLLRSHNQTTAIDIWAAGVIFASLLAGHTPIFRNVDDATSLAEVITIFGSQRMQQTARQLRIKLISEPERAPIDLAYLCRTIRRSSEKRRPLDIPDVAFDLLNHMLDPSPFTRITANQALQHKMFGDLSSDN